MFINDNTQQSDLKYIRKIMGEPILKIEDELELSVAWYDEHDEKAMHRIICAYSRLVVSFAIRFRHYGLPIGDLIQEGNIGIMQAISRFDHLRGVRFATYARWWIRASIQDYILRNWSIVRIGSTVAQKQLFFNLQRLRTQLLDITTESMQPQHLEKIATTLHVSINDVENMEKRLSSGHDLSLSNYMNEDSEEEWIDSIQDLRPNPESVVFDLFDIKTRKYWINLALKTLNEREQQIILYRHLYEAPLTLETVGDIIGISKERVRQIESKALIKMRFYLIEHIKNAEEIL